MIEREALVAAIMAFLAGQDAHTLDAIRESLEREVDEAGPHALAQLSERFANAGADWGYYPPDPLVRRLYHVLADRLLDPGSILVGAEQTNADSGTAYVFRQKGATWTQQHELTPTDGGTTDKFGYSVSLSGTTGIVGADQSEATAGSAYIYKF